MEPPSRVRSSHKVFFCFTVSYPSKDAYFHHSPPFSSLHLEQLLKNTSLFQDVPRYLLVGGFKHALFSIIYIYIWDVILPIDELIFFKMVKTTTKQFTTEIDHFIFLQRFADNRVAVNDITWYLLLCRGQAGFDSLVTAQLYAYLREISPAQVKEAMGSCQADRWDGLKFFRAGFRKCRFFHGDCV